MQLQSAAPSGYHKASQKVKKSVSIAKQMIVQLNRDRIKTIIL